MTEYYIVVSCINSVLVFMDRMCLNAYILKKSLEQLLLKEKKFHTTKNHQVSWYLYFLKLFLNIIDKSCIDRFFIDFSE